LIAGILDLQPNNRPNNRRYALIKKYIFSHNVSRRLLQYYFLIVFYLKGEFIGQITNNKRQIPVPNTMQKLVIVFLNSQAHTVSFVFISFSPA
jgi:hypothetical protein